MEEIRTILVAGANSHLGRAIINRLENDVNNRIIAVSRELPVVLTRITGVRYLIYNELLNDRNINNIDIIINCAYPRRENANEENLQQTRTIAQILMRQGIERWNSQLYLNMSCHSVYGQFRRMPITEAEEINIANLDRYAEHRLTTERLLEKAECVAQNGIKLINLRLADMVGKMYSQPIIDNMIQTALQDGEVTPFNTTNRYTFIDIDDVTRAISRIINGNWQRFNNTVYNLGAADNITITTQNIAEILNNSDSVLTIRQNNHITVNVPINNEHNGEISYLMNSDRLFNTLQWQPEVSFVNSIENRIHILM